MKIDWAGNHQQSHGSPEAYSNYAAKVEYFKQLRSMLEELQFVAEAEEILENYKICFLDFEDDGFPRINIKRTHPTDENNTEEIC